MSPRSCPPVNTPPNEITRYPNRRFYDRSLGRYVTLPEIADRIRQGATVAVRDSRTGEDLTRTVLAQIILERFPERMRLFPAPLLHWILRADDLAAQWMQTYLEQGIALFQAGTQASPIGPESTPPVAGAVPDWLQKLWTPWPGGTGAAPPAATSTPADPGARTANARPVRQPAPPDPVQPPSARESSERLHTRIEELEQRLRELEGRLPAVPRRSPATRPKSRG